MSVNQIKIFKISINPENDFDLEEKAIEVINDFLKDDNIIYINHSMVLLTKDVRENAHFITINKYIAVSVVYKNLKESNIDVSKLHPKIKEKVKNTLAKDEKAMPKPNFKTEIDNISAI